MAPLPVRDHFNVCKHCRLGLLSRAKVVQIHEFSCEGMKEALRDGVVSAIALMAHTGLFPRLGQELPRAVRPILAAAVRRHDQPRRGLALAAGHGPCLGHECHPPRVRHRPANHGSRPPSAYHRERQPACAGRARGHLPDESGSGCVDRALTLELVRGSRLGPAGGRRRVALTPRGAGQTRLSQDAPEATAADLQTRLRHQVFAPACAVGTTALGNIRLDCRLPCGAASVWALGGRPRHSASPLRDTSRSCHRQRCRAAPAAAPASDRIGGADQDVCLSVAKTLEAAIIVMGLRRPTGASTPRPVRPFGILQGGLGSVPDRGYQTVIQAIQGPGAVRPADTKGGLADMPAHPYHLM